MTRYWTSLNLGGLVAFDMRTLGDFRPGWIVYFGEIQGDGG
jgi:hypothetical protein